MARQRNGEGRRFVPPRSSHDVHEQISDMRRWLSLDLDDMIADGDLGPHTMITRTRTRFAEAVEALTACGFGDGQRGLVPTSPGADRAYYSVVEAIYLTKRQNIDELYMSVLNLNLHGNRVYHYTDAIVQWMLNTRMNVPCQEIELPFPALTMTSRSETLVRVFLGTKRQAMYRPNSTITVTAALRRGVDKDGRGYGHLSLITHLLHGTREVERTIAKISLKDGEVASDAVKAYCREAETQEPNPYTASAAGERMIEEWFDESAEAYYRAIVNCLLYLTTPSATISEPYQPQNHDAATGTRSRAQVQDVGRGMDPIFVRSSDILTLLSRGRKGTGTKLAWRILVAGHWRSFPGYALSGDKTKRNWIKPFWRGDETSPVRNKQYVVVRGDAE